MGTNQLHPGDPAPRFRTDSSFRRDHAFDLQAGRYVTLTFVGRERVGEPGLIAALARTAQEQGGTAQQWLVLDAPLDEALWTREGGSAQARYFLDPDGEIRRQYRVDAAAGLASFVISPRFHILAAIDDPDAARHAERARAVLKAQIPVGETNRVWGNAPVLIIPHVFEPGLCQMLIEGYEKHGGHASYFMREENGRTVPRLNDGFKVRRDWMIDDPAIQNHVAARFNRRVIPEIQRAYNFTVQYLERHLVACYDAAEGGHFAAHRDNTTRGTEHRRFACSLNLNDDYDGGTLIFPEFGMQQFKPGPGACVIFSSSLLHQANRVTRGRRYAYLPFLHDQAAQAIFDRNKQFIEDPPVHA